MTEATTLSRKQVARRVRYAIVLTLREAAEPMTVAALTDTLLAGGVPLGATPNKKVADTLRWEVKFGRVWKHGRGKYGYARMSDSTLRWMRQESLRVAPGLPRAWSAMAPEPLSFEERVARTIREAEDAFVAHPQLFAQTLPELDADGRTTGDEFAQMLPATSDPVAWSDGGCAVNVGAIEASLRDFDPPPL